MPALHRIGGSSADRILNCHGSSALCAVMPEQEETGFATDGTAAHRVCELALTEGIVPADLVGRTVDAKGTRVEVTEEMAAASSAYVDYVAKHFTELNGQVDLVIKATLRVEQHVELAGFHDRCAGTCDASLFNSDTGTLHVFDFKYGSGVPVEAENNSQLKFYALGALLALGTGAERIVIHVVQPRCEHPDGPIRHWETDVEDLIGFGLELAAAIEKGEQPGAKRTPGDWCQFCTGAARCDALLALAEDAKRCEEHDALMAAMGDALDPAEVGRRLSLVGPLKIWSTAFRRYAWQEAQRGRIPTDWKLVAIRGRRSFIEPELALSQASRVFGIDEDKFFKRRPITPAQFEKIVGKKKAEGFLEPYITKSKGLSLVPLADKREAVAPETLSEFDDLFSEEATNGEE